MKNNQDKMYPPMSKTELAKAYGITRRTLKKWIAPIEERIGEYIGKKYSTRQLSIIFKFCGRPKI